MRLSQFIREEWQQFITLNPSNRRWPMPFAAALASGVPLLIGAYFSHLEYGLISSLGGLVFVYLPNTELSARMVTLMVSAFFMTACYALGVISHFWPSSTIPMLVFITILVTMLGRYHHLGPPGSLFFVMAAAIGAHSPIPVLHLPLVVGLLFMGTLLAVLIAFFYSLYALRQQAAQANLAPEWNFDFVIFDAVIIGIFVGIALALAQLLQLDRPYWVPVSCLAVIQGASLRAVWNKQLHRVLGTVGGLLLAWLLLLLPLNPWAIAVIMMGLSFIIETLVVRHYGLAVIFVTPLTILLAEAISLGQAPATELIQARFFDTALGCLVGLIGGVVIHSPRCRALLSRPLRCLLPLRLRG